MKRLLLLPALLFGLFFVAQAQEYEEVHGIKIGAPIEEVEELDGYEKGSICELATYSLEPYRDVQWIFLIAMDGIVHSVSVGIDKANYEEYLASVNLKYGEPSKVEVLDGETLLEYNLNGVVSVISIGDIEPIAQYLTKKLADNYIDMTIDCI